MKKLWGALFHDPVDICILGYKDHPSIILILEKVSVLNLFTFLEITKPILKDEFWKRILKRLVRLETPSQKFQNSPLTLVTFHLKKYEISKW